ncbi:hypothetical protein MBUL_03079 [Methylobacterium bullatum]|uniref:Uncharacterized protein n=1 Tax=Methylobacterium bullatum TaxID=570505 RepID=A0A679J222_9HYPH|nr:hypothetical protein MBUL_03079 [Methylobacterium bullatum]
MGAASPSTWAPFSGRSNTDRIHAGEGEDANVGGRAGVNQYPSERVEPR